jgi:predicted permease
LRYFGKKNYITFAYLYRVIYKLTAKAKRLTTFIPTIYEMLVPGSPFQSCLMFLGKGRSVAKSVAKSVAPERFFALIGYGLLANIRLC